MRMTVVNVRIVGVFMHQRFVTMHMSMGFSAVPRKIVRVLVMLVMPVRMVMMQRLMGVLVFVPLPQMQPDPQRHQRCGEPERHARRLRPNQERDQHAEQWSHGEVGPGSGGTENAQPHYEQREANAIPSESHQHVREHEIRWMREHGN